MLRRGHEQRLGPAATATNRGARATWLVAAAHRGKHRRPAGDGQLGGSTRVVVLDNLKEGVLTPDIYDPALNPLYRDALAHYGVVGLPCRVGDPNRKGKVESGIGHTQKTPLQRMRFETIEEGQAYLDRWATRWADTRIHGTTKRQVAVMFAEEQPALQPLPLEPFRYYRFSVRTVHLDGCVEIDAAYYSAPPGLDRPPRLLAVERSPRPLAQADDRATPAGARARTARVASHRRRRPTESHAGKNAGRLERRAPRGCLDLGVPTYHFIRRYLERRPPVPLTLRQVDPLIRQLTLYRDLIDRRTGDSE